MSHTRVPCSDRRPWHPRRAMLPSVGLLLAIAAAVLAGCLQSEAPTADSQAGESRRVATALFDALSRGDIEAIDALYAADFELWTAGSLPFSGRHDKAYALAATGMILDAFPKGLRFTIDAITAEGERGGGCCMYAWAVEREESVLIAELRRRCLLPWCDFAKAALDDGSSRLAILPLRFETDLLGLRT